MNRRGGDNLTLVMIGTCNLIKPLNHLSKH